MTTIATRTEDTIIINTITGKVVLLDIVHFINSNIDAWLGKLVLWDFSGSDFSEVSSEHIRGFSEAVTPVSAKKAGEKIALVASSDLEYGLWRAFVIQSEDSFIEAKLECFRTIDEAKDWLLEEDG